MRTGVTLRQLAYFIAVAETGTTAAAAERHYMSQSAISAALTDLERTLQVQVLIRRRGKGVELTGAGREILADARHLLTAAEELERKASGLQQSLSGSLVVGCFATIAPQVMPRLLAGFADLHPEVDVDFLEEGQPELHAALLEGRLELAVLYDHDTPDGIVGEVLYAPRAHVLLPSGHRLADAASVSLRQLAGEPFVLLEAHPSQLFVRETFAAAGVEPAVRFRSRSFEHIRALVHRGLGYTVLAEREGGDPHRWGPALKSVLVADPVPPQTIMLARAAGARMTRRAQAFRDLCLDTALGSLPAVGPETA
ncbi:LysR substrate-binding domain-containing protein [Georgenia sp. H159]|uniref:LysR substrate-binding domain-containing protein n=1 Tax=Georgenia sp. H159 TaxID=3076115 RepID=UPI002D78BA8D|nr:LysR substrate-binding domain-containing protein [Georgenia sp. H159]